MKKILDLITEELEQAFEEAGYEKELAKVTLSNRPDLCEYQCNGAMAGAKKYHKAPIMIAEEVVAKITGDGSIREAEAVKPGFINLKTNPDYIAGYLNEMAKDDKFGVEEEKNPKTILIDRLAYIMLFVFLIIVIAFRVFLPFNISSFIFAK